VQIGAGNNKGRHHKLQMKRTWVAVGGGGAVAIVVVVVVVGNGESSDAETLGECGATSPAALLFYQAVSSPPSYSCVREGAVGQHVQVHLLPFSRVPTLL
jgi:hypothetical protein